MQKEVFPARSWTLELAAIAGAVAALTLFTSACTVDVIDETSCAHFEALRDSGIIVPTSERTEIEYAPFPALWGDVYPLQDSAGHYIGQLVREPLELRDPGISPTADTHAHHTRRGTVLVIGSDQCEWFDAIN